MQINTCDNSSARTARFRNSKPRSLRGVSLYGKMHNFTTSNFFFVTRDLL